jgi:hypothetical protein
MDIQEVDQKIYIDESKFNDIQDIDAYCVELLSDMYKENPDNEAYVKQLLNEFLRLRNYMRN